MTMHPWSVLFVAGIFHRGSRDSSMFSKFNIAGRRFLFFLAVAGNIHDRRPSLSREYVDVASRFLLCYLLVPCATTKSIARSRSHADQNLLYISNIAWR